MALSFSRVVAAPVGRVFALVDDPEMQKLWRAGLLDTVATSEHRREAPVGATFRQRVRTGTRVVSWRVEILEWERPRVIAVRVAAGAVRVDVRWRFEAQGDGRTRVSWSAEPSGGGVARWLAGPVVGLFGGRALGAQVAALAALAEAEAAGSPGLAAR
ncbi:MAG: SRPBCC family protein [Deltaproteobacteria bacterium]|nr:SRPBCC family protein [Deltaproteobacteria bacterium]MCB9788688.1 SRPBCC family protein [Deltaproteobacteria bacterium]